jgi:hypothetical protein
LGAAFQGNSGDTFTEAAGEHREFIQNFRRFAVVIGDGA